MALDLELTWREVEADRLYLAGSGKARDILSLQAYPPVPTPLSRVPESCGWSVIYRPFSKRTARVLTRIHGPITLTPADLAGMQETAWRTWVQLLATEDRLYRQLSPAQQVSAVLLADSFGQAIFDGIVVRDGTVRKIR